MDIIHFTITNPVKVAVGVILVVLFGTLALFQIPIQLTPNVDQPKVTVTTRWAGKNAKEVEREIIDRQEEKLKSVSGLRKMTSVAREGQAEVTLEFFVGIDKDVALRDTDEKLNQVSGYPEEVEKPEVIAADSALENPIAWILFKADDGRDVSTLRDFVWDDVKPILERVDGLASVDVYGGREREVHVLIDPARLAARGLTMVDVERALVGQNVNTSAGTIERGKLDFVYRTVGEYEATDQVERTVIAYTPGGPVFVRDVGRVVNTFEKTRTFVRSKGQWVLALPARRETGANVVEVMRGLRKQIAKVNDEILRGRGLSLELTQVYDETTYIDSSIDLVRSNLYLGGVLAIAVLLVFLRSARATFVVAVSIPISVIGTFLAVTLLGRSLNVVMLSGMAFAVGMVVDNAIVVVENVYRHLQMGKTGFQAAQGGASEVWGGILASTLTTMAVFIPVIFVKEEAGQLFRDIAIAISAGVFLSLLVAVLVVPTMAARVLGGRGKSVYKTTKKLAAVEQASRISTGIADFVAWINRRRLVQLLVVLVFVAGSVVGSYLLMPPRDYLPSGNRNLVFGFVITEPGLGVNEYRKIAEDMEAYVRPYWEAKPGSPEAAALPPVMMPVGEGGADGQPRMVEVRPAPIENFFIGTFQGMCFIGATSTDPLNVKPLTVLLQQAAMSSKNAIGGIPVFFQASLFGGVNGGNTVDIELRGDNLDQVNNAAKMMVMSMMQKQLGMPRPDPMTFDLPRPEIRAMPDLVRAADVGLTTRDVGFIVAAAVDGAYVGPFRDAGDEIDLKVKLERPDGSPIQDVRDVPIYTPSGNVVPLASVVNFEEIGAPQQINHIEEMPAVTLQVRPPTGMAIETVVNEMRSIVDELRRAGQIAPTVYVSMAGNADKLAQTRNAMFGHWTGFNIDSLGAVVQSRGFLALLVTYLLMAALFESFIHPIAILLTVPLATVGGFGGLHIVHWLSLRDPVSPIQQLDVVTMLGFVILLGIVVNNAILIVHQMLNNLGYGMTPFDALHESLRTRIRPIFMTAFTSVGGMLPLALMPGAGSELYRGLASVMTGGLMVATLFTVILVPVVYSMVFDFRGLVMRLLGRADEAVPLSKVHEPAVPSRPPRDLEPAGAKADG